MTMYQTILLILYKKEYTSSQEIAKILFEGNKNKTYQYLAELQKRKLVISMRTNPEKGGSSSKLYKITVKGVRQILPDLEAEQRGLKIPTRNNARTGKPEQNISAITPKFPRQSDTMKRKLVIDEIEKSIIQGGWRFLQGQEALEGLISYVARLEKAPYSQAKRAFLFEMKDIVIMPPLDKQATIRPFIYLIPYPQAGQQYVIDHLETYDNVSKYFNFCVVPITEMQIYSYAKMEVLLPGKNNKAQLIDSKKYLPK